MNSSNGDNFKFLFILTVLLIYPLPQLAIDIYLPSWPAMVTGLHTTTLLLQTSLTIYIFFLGTTQLIYGPLSDRFGRKPILLIGSIIFLVSSLAAMFATSISQLLFFRALQGIGMGCGFAVASAVLADAFQGKQLAKMTTYSAMIYSVSSILAPLAGAYLQHYFGWQANFLAMMIYALVLMVFLYFFVEETNTNLDKSKNFAIAVVKKYGELLSDISFTGNVICLTMVYGIMISFSVLGPFILQSTLHVSTIFYGKLLMIVGLSYLFGATLNKHLLKKHNIHSLIIAGLSIIAISGLLFLFLGFGGWFNPMSVTLFTGLSMVGIGFVFPNCFANALDISPEKGIAGAFIGSAGLIGTSIISLIIVHLHIDHKYILPYIYLALTVLSTIAYLLSQTNKKRKNKIKRGMT